MIPGPELACLLEGRSLLIFDFDGTIADTSPLHAQAFREVLEPLGLMVDYPRMAGLTTLDAIRTCFELNGREEPGREVLDQLARQKQVRGREAISAQLTAFPAAAALLRWSRPNYRLALVSSGSRATIDLALARLGFDGWFDPILTADELGQAKPDPEGFLSAVEICGSALEQSLIFEDSAAGFEAARRAGIDAVDATRLESMMIEGAVDGD